MKTYLEEVKGFYRFVLRNYAHYKKKESRMKERSKANMPKNSDENAKEKPSEKNKASKSTAKGKRETQPIRKVS